MNIDDLSEEVYFLKYAFPCAFVTLQRRKITQEEYDELESAAYENGKISRERLTKVFAPAVRRMKKLAEEKVMELWSKELMKEYYWHRHNEIIDSRDESYAKAPDFLCELCRIVRAEVVRVEKNGYVVKIDNKRTRSVMSLCGVLDVGDQVMIHYGYACEKVT